MAEAFGWGALGAAALLAGALIAYLLSPSRGIIAVVMALGTGLLIGSVSFELVDDALEHQAVAWVALMVLLGAVSFLTRVPVGTGRRRTEELAGFVPWFPVVGAGVGLAVAAIYAGSRALLPPLPAASLAVVAGVAFLVGFRPEAGVLDWLAAVALLAGMSLGVAWLSVAAGLVSTPESASNYTMPLSLLPFLGSGFVPTDSLPGWLRAFAEHQPFTPFIETVRGLLVGTAIGSSGWLSVAWSAGIALAGYLWARRLFARTR